jgi:response regulator RpfG family c-di-GMP phosphodiesterase
MSVKISALSVDDEKTNLLLLEAMAAELGINVHSFLTPIAALEYTRNNDVDLIFTDYMMPGMNGIEFIEAVRLSHPHIHIIMITSVTDDETLKLRAIKAGATEFLNKPLNVAEFKARVSNIIELHSSRLLLRDKALLLESEVKSATAEITARELETLRVLARAAEYRDRDTGAHVTRVAHFSKLLAESAGAGPEEQELIFGAAPLHDVGKIGIPDAILMKEGPLTPEETTIMKTHPLIGYGILKDSKSKILQTGSVICLSHHERYDGTGYPGRIKAKDIPLWGRIVAIADVFDALSNRRPYKEAWAQEHVINYLRQNSGTHFDPWLIDFFIGRIDEVLEIRDRFRD